MRPAGGGRLTERWHRGPVYSPHVSPPAVSVLIPRSRPRPRRFEYEPRFYDPSKDQRLKRRMHFKRKTRRGKQPAFVGVAVLLLVALGIYTHL